MFSSSIACSAAMKKPKVTLIPEILSVCLCEPNVGFYFSSLEAFRIFFLPWYSVISIKMCIGVNLFSSVELVIDGFFLMWKSRPLNSGDFSLLFCH